MGGNIALVTEGARFIGSLIVEALVARGRRVRVLDVGDGRRTDVTTKEGERL